MRRLAAALLAAALVAAVAASTSPASRPASDQERQQVANAVGVPVECSVVEVSTVDASWARFEGTNASGCPQGNGFILLHQSGGGWSIVIQGSEPAGCEPDGIPVAVGLDLEVCRHARTYLLCKPRGSDKREIRERPRKCDTLGPHDSFAEAVNLVSLRWHGWGRAVATATGIERGFHRPLAHVPVTVKAWRRRPACGDYVYTRVRATSADGGSTTARLPARCGDS